MWKKYKPSDVLAYSLILTLVGPTGYYVLSGKIKTADDLIFTFGTCFVIANILVVVFLFLLNISRVIFKKGDKKVDKAN